MRRLVSTFLALAALATSSLALADLPPITDEVQTTDGATYRGTIVEDVPNGDVVLLLPTGETRRFPRSRIRSVGPLPRSGESVSRPSDTANGYTVQQRPVPVRFEANETSTLFAEADSAIVPGTRLEVKGYTRLCTSPCSLSVPAGTQRFGIARGGDAPQGVEATLPVEQPSILRAQWPSFGGLRVAGILILSVGVTAGVGMSTVGYVLGYGTDSCNTPGCYDTPRTVTWVGLGVTLASAAAGVTLLLLRHKVTIDVSPLQVAPTPIPGVPASATPDSKSARLSNGGAAVTVRF
jgi:hypothetical protein